MRARVRLIGFVVFALLLSQAGASAQAVPSESIEDKELGWIRILNAESTAKPVTVDHRVFSSAQLAVARLFANWMQASYLPKAALGNVFLLRNENLSPYNQNTAARPQSYGNEVRLYTDLKYGANKKIEPATNTHVVWTLEANGFMGIPADEISTPERYYFTLPTFAQQVFTNRDGTDLEKAAAVSGHPFLGQFPTFFLRNSVSGNQRFVLLSKDRRLPWVTLTKGQYLDALAVAIDRKRAAEVKRITEAEQGNQKRIAPWVEQVDALTAKRKTVLAGYREKYKNRLQEVAEVWTDAPSVMLENMTGYDVFENSGFKTRLPVYTFDPKVIELCKTDAPQWLVMSWTAHLNDPASAHLHQAVLNNVNFQYIYDYFFDPAKVKGQPYAPLRSISAAGTTAAAKPSATPSAAAAKMAADPAVVFFDDFSTEAVGSKPVNWRSSRDDTGASSVVTELKGLDGRWASIGGVQLSMQMKTPLPSDFDLSYDIVAGQNYRWGARGLTFKVSRRAAGGRESFFSLRIRPGFDGRPGEAQMSREFPGTPGADGYLLNTGYPEAPGFSNDKPNNRITVTMKKKGELLQVFIGTTRIIESAKGIPAGLQFDTITVDAGGPEDRMYIGNVRVAKQ